MTLSKEEAARRLGVPEHEVLDVRADGDADQVTTSDGVTYHVTGEQVAYAANYPPDTFFPVHEAPPPPPAAEEAGTEDLGAEPPQGGEPPAADTEEVPDGTVGHVLAWVNRDRSRASRALAAERAREEPRTTLVEQLERLANP